MHVIGLTGSIGAGKSEVAATLERLGATVINADEEGHAAYVKGSMGWRRIAELFGEGVLTEDREIDRRKLGQLVFGSPQAMAWLNAAVHPLIRERLESRLKELEQQGCAVAVVDAAVLVQAGWNDLVDEIWLVKAPVDRVVERLESQRGLQSWEVRARIDAQQDMVRQAEALADVVIENADTVAALHAQIERLWKERNLSPRQQ